eukprot:TRINITY_DN1866_c0_g1_i1.p1 TRINITY_DN1866_c0_g1~~TRINITY_DN1866_c0_g1_i1.p1  ORF type:complete len:541 (-),score=154.23 TRINITY_DN1866_c0_g1_i1:102-1724(-)
MYPGDNEFNEPEEARPASMKERMTELAAPLLEQVDRAKEEMNVEKQKQGMRDRYDRLRRYMQQEGTAVILFLIWIGINVALWIEHAILYWNEPNFFVTIARGFGQTLNFNCALILLPVSRNLLTFLRGTFLHYVVPFDYNITFHRRVAWAIAYATAGHGVAHYFNYNLQDAPYTFAWATLAGVTGNLLTLIIVAMYSTAIDSIKRRYFNMFWFTHHLFIVFFILLLLHGPNFWIWFIAPGAIYLVERVMREWRGKQSTSVHSIIKHPSDVIEIRMKKKSFKYKPGQYLFLNCPHLSFYEWHPFTISSAPHEDFVSCHIRCVGKWTKGLRDYIAPPEEGELVMGKSRDPAGKRMIRIDGPFGAASEEVFEYKVLMLVGAGIGVTPFASVLKALYHRKTTGAKCKVEKVHFFWSARDVRAFEWFQVLLRDLELAMSESGERFLTINIYLTARMKEEQIQELVAKEAEGDVDSLTALESRTNFGRPNFERIMTDLRDDNPGKKVGVFFCGPRVLAKSLRELSRTLSAKHKADGAKFVFMKENF